MAEFCDFFSKLERCAVLEGGLRRLLFIGGLLTIEKRHQKSGKKRKTEDKAFRVLTADWLCLFIVVVLLEGWRFILGICICLVDCYYWKWLANDCFTEGVPYHECGETK